MGKSPPPSEQAMVNKYGVDLTLIHWIPSLTPDERMDMLDRFFAEMQELHDG
jgi:hypothetical protein